MAGEQQRPAHAEQNRLQHRQLGTVRIPEVQVQRLVEIGYVLDRQGLVQSVLPPDLLNHLRRLRLQTEILVLTDNVYHRVARHKPDEDEIDGYDTEDDKNSLHQAFSQTRKAQIAYPLPFYIQSRGARLRRPCSRPLLSQSDADYTKSRS